MADRLDRLTRTQGKLALCGALVPFVIALVAHAAGSVPQTISQSPSQSSLAFSQYLVDKGRVDPTALENAKFRFANRSSEPLEITKVKTSCGCLQPIVFLGEKQHRPDQDGRMSLTVNPGETGEILLRIQTANQEPGAKEYTVSVHSHDSQSRTTELMFRIDLPERGVIVRPGQMLLYQFSGVPTEREVVVTDMRNETLSIEGVRCDSELVQFKIANPRTNQHGFREFPIQLTVAGKVPPGKQVTVVRIFTDDPSYPELRIPMWIYGPEKSAGKTAAADRAQPKR